MIELTEEQKEAIFEEAYHWRYEDNFGWKSVCELVNQGLKTNYDTDTVKKVCEVIAKREGIKGRQNKW